MRVYSFRFADLAQGRLAPWRLGCRFLKLFEVVGIKKRPLDTFAIGY